MPGNREDLRQRVTALEATVDGLTQELVEAIERIRQLEADDEDVSADKPMPERDQESTEETESATEEREEETEIIVA